MSDYLNVEVGDCTGAPGWVQSAISRCHEMKIQIKDEFKFLNTIKWFANGHTARLYMSMSITEREALLPNMLLEFDFDCPFEFIASKGCCQITRDGLAKMLCHELDERILVDGKRQWDPHVNGNTKIVLYDEPIGLTQL